MKLFIDTWGWVESMVVMSELGITDVMTEDDHFLHVGMGFKKVP